MGRLNASMVEVIALREEVRLFLLVKRLASQLMVGVVSEDGRPAEERWARGVIQGQWSGAKEPLSGEALTSGGR